MSMMIERFLVCDGEDCGETYGVDDHYRDAKEHRQHAKKAGWTYRNGKDYCEVCSAARNSGK